MKYTKLMRGVESGGLGIDRRGAGDGGESSFFLVFFNLQKLNF